MSKHFEHICPFCEEIYCVNLPNDVQAVLTAAEALTARVEYPESWYPEAQALFAAVHVLKEMEEKDE